MVQLPPSLPVIASAVFRLIRTSHKKRGFSSSPRSLSSADEFEVLESLSNADQLAVLESVAEDLKIKKLPPAQRIKEKKNHDAGRYVRHRGAHSADLPISPYMDSAVIAAREKYRNPKAAPSKSLTPFQTKLQHNVYAQALATPIRTCGATQARLPLFFLLGFHLWRHPETGAPWYLPTGLSDARPNFGAQPGSARNSQTLTAGTESEDYGESQPELLKPLSRLPEAGKLRLPATQPEGRMVGRCSVVRDSKELVGKSRGWNRIIPKRLLERNVVKPREIIWREDMESFVLRLLRDRVVQRLKNLLHGGSGYLAKSTGGLDGINEVEVGCVLWLGPTTVPIRDGIGVPFDTGMPPLPKSARIDDSMDLATMNYSGMQVPVHNLAKLLGKKHLELLRKPGSYFDSEITIIKHKLNTLPARRQLWRLEGYLAD